MPGLDLSGELLSFSTLGYELNSRLVARNRFLPFLIIPN
jgi:hypothetical protein